MNIDHQTALLIAVTLPVAAIVALNAWLAFRGERDTLLLPGIASFPTEPDAIVEPVRSEGGPAGDPANDPDERLAA